MAQTKHGLEVTDPAAYREKSFALPGDRDPIPIMEETADILGGIVTQHTSELLRARPFPGKWTPNEVIGHLGDAEWVLGFRVRMILAEEQPAILGMDQDLWVTAQRHNDRKPRDLVEMFRGLRLFNLPIWKQLTPDDLQRVGMHDERGPESLETMLRMYAAHDLHHIDQINRYLEAAKEKG